MKVLYKIYLLCICVVFVTRSQAQQANISVDTTSAMIGEPIVLDIKVSSKSELNWPGWEKGVSGFEVLEVGELKSKKSGDEIVYMQSLRLTQFDVGSFKLGPIGFLSGSDSIFTKAIKIDYSTVKLESEEIYDIQDPVNEPFTIGEFVKENGYSDRFVNHYIVPMGSAIWSASVDVMMEFPLKFFLKFFNNHGMLSVDNRPQWRVISNGSQSYIEPLIAPFKDKIHLNSPIAEVTRLSDKVIIKTFSGDEHEFDQVVFACHSDQALGMLTDATQQESDILGAIPYQMNEVVLHTDRRLMPKRKLAWAAWNYHIPQRLSEFAMVTYHMNALQNINDAPDDFMVTLNRTAEIAPGKIIDKYDYAHPVFTMDGIAAQHRHSEINNKNRSHYCGAYWFNGFHEDGVNSALRVAESFGIEL